MATVRSLLLQLTALAAFLGTAAAVKHDEAPVVTVNGTLSEHFTAHVTEIQPGACVIFEAQARAPQDEGQLCIAHSGVKVSAGGPLTKHPTGVLPDGCAAQGLRIAEVVAPNKDACFLHKAQQLDQAGKVFEECNPDSPYSFQFIDPTRHQPTYGAQRSNATTALCQMVMGEVPNKDAPDEGGIIVEGVMGLELKRSRVQHTVFTHKCLKSATYVVVNPCNAPIASMVFEGTSKQCLAGGWEGDHTFPTCTPQQGGGGVAGAGARLASGLAVAFLIAVAVAAAVALLARRHRVQEARAMGLQTEDVQLTSGYKSSSHDPERPVPPSWADESRRTHGSPTGR